MNYTIFDNDDIELYFLDFLSICEMKIYLLLSHSCYGIFKESKYFKEITKYKGEYGDFSADYLCEGGYLDLLKLYLKDKRINYETDISLPGITIQQYLISLNAVRSAIYRGKTEMIKYLIGKGADKKKILHWVIKSNSLELVEYVILGIDTAEINYVSLLLSVECGYIGLVKYFAARCNSAKYYLGAIQLADQMENSEIMEYLTGLYGDKIVERDYAICQAFRGGDLLKVKSLRIGYQKDYSYFLPCVVEKGYLEIVKYLVADNGSVPDCYLLQMAAKGGNIPIMQYLISLRQNIQMDNFNLAEIAAINGNLEMVTYLFSIDVIIKLEDCMTMTLIIKNGHLAILKFLFAIDKNYLLKIRKYYLGVAVKKGHIDIVKFLSNGIIDIKTNRYYNIICAAKNGHLEMTKYLISCGDYQKNAAVVQKAVEYGHLEIVKYLHSIGQNVMMDNYLAFRLAASRGHLDIVKYLLSLDQTIRENQKLIRLVLNEADTRVINYLNLLYNNHTVHYRYLVQKTIQYPKMAKSYDFSVNQYIY